MFNLISTCFHQFIFGWISSDQRYVQHDHASAICLPIPRLSRCIKITPHFFFLTYSIIGERLTLKSLRVEKLKRKTLTWQNFITIRQKQITPQIVPHNTKKSVTNRKAQTHLPLMSKLLAVNIIKGFSHLLDTISNTFRLPMHVYRGPPSTKKINLDHYFVE